MLALGGSLAQPDFWVLVPVLVHAVCAPLTKSLDPPFPRAQATVQSVAAAGSVPNSAAAMLSPWDPAPPVTSNSDLTVGSDSAGSQLSKPCGTASPT